MQLSAQTFESATDAVGRFGVGWNLGNTLDSNNGNACPDIVQSETMWGQPVTQPELFHMLHAAGFGAVRVPVTWYPHMDGSGKVDAAWMQRVHEVVDYVLASGMYCILNVHHDTGNGDGHWITAATQVYDATKERYELLDSQYREVSAEVDELENKAQEAREKSAEKSALIDQLREEMHSIELDNSQAGSRIAVKENDISHLNEAIEKLGEQISQSDSAKYFLEAELEEKKKQYKQYTEAVESDDETLAGAAKEAYADLLKQGSSYIDYLRRKIEALNGKKITIGLTVDEQGEVEKLETVLNKETGATKSLKEGLKDTFASVSSTIDFIGGTFDSVEVKDFPQLAISHDDLEDDIKIFFTIVLDDKANDNFLEELITKITFTAAIESVAPGKSLEIESALGLINDSGNFGLPYCDNEPEKKFERTFKENGVMYLFSRDDKIISLCFFK